MASVMESIGEKGCSIVVHQGLFIDPTSMIMGIFPNRTKNFSLEIVGIENVRILNISTINGVHLLGFAKVDIAFKNVIIYGHRHSQQSAIIASAGRLTLTDVKIHGSDGFPLFCMDSSELEASDCVFSEVTASFGSRIFGSSAKFSNCRWYNEVGDECGGFSSDKERDIQAEEATGLAECKVAVHVAGRGNATFRHCQFISKIGTDGRMRTHAPFSVTKESRLSLTSCHLSGFVYGAVVKDSGSRAIIKSCEILDCDSAIFSQFNSSASILQCELITHLVATLHLNEKGKILFRGNTVKPSKYPSSFPLCEPPPLGTAVVHTDRQPKVLEHDFPQVRFHNYRPCQEYSRPCRAATRDSRESYAEFHSNMTKAFGPLHWSADEKFCVVCMKNATDNPEVKFQYCMNCRKDSYCSKECQLAHWRDHKLVCKKEQK